MTTLTPDSVRRTEELKKRVLKGAALLDEMRPGWREKINPDSINVWNVRNCPLGQVYGDYYLACIDLGIQDDPTYGFNTECSGVGIDGSPCSCRSDAATLNILWKEIL